MKRSLRLDVLAFLVFDAILFLTTYLLLGQAQSSEGAALPAVAPDNNAAAPIALEFTPSSTPYLASPVPIQASPAATETLSPTDTAQPSPIASNTARPSASPTPTATVTPSALATASSTAQVLLEPSPTNTLQPTFTPTRLRVVTDLGILPVPTATITPTATQVRDLGILPSLTPTATRVIPTRPPVTRVAASNGSPVPTNTRVPTAQPYTSPAPECIPHGRPVGGILFQRFSRWHTGIDLDIPVGTPVLATQSGQVIFAGWRTDGYGNLVIIQNGQFITYYAHNSKLNVTAGQVVHAGDVISQSGSTGWSSGPHVHYEIRINNNPVDPIAFDPQQYQAC
jgi:murein DD-endopeptidase MepM/ murein hydrolase activator NlpD